MAEKHIKTVNQFIYGMYYGDGLWYYLINLRNLFLEAGIKSKIYVEDKNSFLNAYIRPMGEYSDDEKNISILHYTNFFNINTEVSKLKSYKIMDFHNITLPDFFIDYDKDLYNQTKKAYEELKRLPAEFDFFITHSEFSRRVLLTCAPYIKEEKTAVLPVLLDFKRYKKSFLNFSKKTNLLYVSRIFPNKRQDILIDVMDILVNKHKKEFKLYLIGGSLDSYLNELKTKIKEKCLNENIYITGKMIDEKEVYGFYNKCALFLLPSEHEGFCAPAVEASFYGLPVIYNGQPALCGTMEKSGICVKNNNPEEYADEILKVIKSKAYRKKIIKEQNENVKRLKQEMKGYEFVFKKITDSVCLRD